MPQLPVMRDYAQSPSNRGWLNTNVHKDRSAIDIGFRYASVNPKIPANPTQPAYALTDALVLETGYMSDSGNYIVAGASYDKEWDMWWSVQHLNKLPTPKKGQVIKQGEQFGNMGNTGESYGNHFHVRVSFVKAGTPFSWATFGNTRYNPFDYVFAYGHQDVLDLANKPSTPFPVQSESHDYVVKPQLGFYVPYEVMRLRKTPNGEFVTNLDTGVRYDYIGYADVDGIRWVTNGETFVARRRLDGTKEWGSAELIDAPKKTYINLDPKTAGYAIYRTDVPVNKMSRPNNFQEVKPKAMGGISYEATKVAGTSNVYLINTRDFGKVHIAQVDGLATITDTPTYKVYG